MTDLIEPVNEDTFEALVGEGKKFKDPDALAKGKLEADSHIQNLETELATMRAELQGRLSMEELLEKVQTRAPREEVIPPRPSNDENQENGLVTPNLADEVQRIVQAERTKEKRDHNIDVARSGLKERFGADYNTKLKSIAEGLGVSTNLLTDMAATSPAGFIKLIDSIAQPDRDLSMPVTQVNTSGKTQTFTSKTAAYYNDIRKNDPKSYWSKKVQAEMHREAVKQGEAFYK